MQRHGQGSASLNDVLIALLDGLLDGLNASVTTGKSPAYLCTYWQEATASCLGWSKESVYTGIVHLVSSGINTMID